MEGNRCRGVITQSKSGTEYYTCKMLIDVTGDCDVLRSGGVPTAEGKNFYTYIGRRISLEHCARALESGDVSKAFGYITGGNINLYGENQPTDIPLWSGLTAEDVTDYLVRNQLDMLSRLKATDRHQRDIAMLPLMPQFRTTAHLVGDYTFTERDAYQHFEDSVCAINDFDRRDFLYEVPLRALCRRDYPNLLTAGRSACGEGYGWDILRVIPVAILTGQAAAEAACLAIETAVGVADVNIRLLQNRLESENVMIHFPDSYVPMDPIPDKVEKYDVGHF
jgi:hypothetical protein